MNVVPHMTNAAVVKVLSAYGDVKAIAEHPSIPRCRLAEYYDVRHAELAYQKINASPAKIPTISEVCQPKSPGLPTRMLSGGLGRCEVSSSRQLLQNQKDCFCEKSLRMAVTPPTHTHTHREREREGESGTPTPQSPSTQRHTQREGEAREREKVTHPRCTERGIERDRDRGGERAQEQAHLSVFPGIMS
jgi:hypothetical protein